MVLKIKDSITFFRNLCGSAFFCHIGKISIRFTDGWLDFKLNKTITGII